MIASGMASPLFAVLHQVRTLALDEMRALSRSRRGRVAAFLYTLVTLLPVALYCWIRARFIVPWPVDPSTVVPLMAGHQLALVALVTALAHEVYSRGDHEGWQESLSTLPVGELTWMLGRAAGRFLWLLAVLVIPWIAGWGLASLWAHQPMDPLPFLAGFLDGPLLGLVLLFPVAVLAGCVGNSLTGALTVGLMAVVVVQLAGAGAVSTVDKYVSRHPDALVIDLQVPYADILFEDRGYALPQIVSFYHLFRPEYGERSDWVGSWNLSFFPDPGRGWPPFTETLDGYRLRAAAAHWLLFLAAAPTLVRLRRRAGRWSPRTLRFPTFTRWLSETLDQARPVIPDSPLARRLCVAAALALLAGGLSTAIRALDLQGEIAAAHDDGIPVDEKPYPDVFEPSTRKLELAIASDGTLTGREVISGRVHGRPAHPLPFSMEMGYAVRRVLDGEGRACAWQHFNHLLWVVPNGVGEQTLEIAFSGRPQKNIWVGRTQWTRCANLLDAPQPMRRHRRWFINLTGSSWAPQPLASVGRQSRFWGRTPCWGVTTLDLRLPAGMIPVPLPPPWKEIREGGAIHAQWEGVSPFLPPVTAGAYRAYHDPGPPDFRLTSVSPGADGPGLLRWLQKGWADQGGKWEVAGITIHDNLSRGSWWQRESSLDPPIEDPPNYLSLPPEILELRQAGMMSEWGGGALQEVYSQFRARLRYAPLARQAESVKPLLARRFLWSLCKRLEGAEWPLQSLLVPAKDQTIFRVLDLDGPPLKNPYYLEMYATKLNYATVALINLIGPEAAGRGLDALSAVSEPLTIDRIWNALTAGDRRLNAFRDQVFLGKGMPQPAIEEVALSQRVSDWSAVVRLVNPGDADVEVPVQVLASGRIVERRIILPAGGKGEISMVLPEPPDQVMLDPEESVLRIKPAHGERWLRKGGLK